MSGGIFHPSIFHPSIFDTGDLAGTTAQTVTATPGKPHWFGAKTEAAGSTPRDDTRFTELSNSALAGKIHSFSAKTEAILPGTPRGTDRFTQLSTTALPGKQYLFPVAGARQVTALQTYALPGRRFSFLPKTEAEVPVEPEVPIEVSKGGGWPVGRRWDEDTRKRKVIQLKESEEYRERDIIDFIITVTSSGILEE